MAIKHRRKSGASLVLVIAIFGGFALLLMLFCLKFTGFMGSYHEQRTAIEAAALAAAKDLSEVVINDPNFGWIGLSDSSPIGTNTAAGDGYYTAVTGINTLFGTIRLDLIISDYLQDPLMQQLALNDYTNAVTAQQNLVTALTNAVSSNSTQVDINGNTLNPILDATNAYQSNQVHLVSGQTSTLVPGSLTLSLGYLNNSSSGNSTATFLPTRTPIPQPLSIGTVTSSQQSQGFYLSNMDIPYTNTVANATTGATPTTDFVFAALGPNSTLVDFRNFATSVSIALNNSSLNLSTPTVIKIDADEQYTDNSGLSRAIHATAAAVPGTVVDQRPYPGAFTITFPDGPPPEIASPGDLINNTQIQADPTDIMQTPLTGDYPQTALTNYSMPFLPDTDKFHPKFENVFSVAFYDWIKRGGTNVNIQNLVNMLSTAMNYGTTPGAQQQQFHFTSSGVLTNNSVTWGQTNLTVSNKQYRAISGLGIVSTNGNSYDLQITDFVRVPGKTNGGMHAGEPLNNPGTTGTNPSSGSYPGPTMYENTTWNYQEFLTGSGIRPTYNAGSTTYTYGGTTYNSEGIAVDFTIRQRH
jgi:hypothetical protein